MPTPRPPVEAGGPAEDDEVAHAPVAWGADPTEWDGYDVAAEDQPDEWRRP